MTDLEGEGGFRTAESAPAALYHYTDLGGLLGLLETSTFWLSSFRTMNDSTETTWLRTCLEQAIANSTVNASEKENLRDVMLSFQPTVEAYVGCFSEHNDKLSQWILYAADGEGISIGFRPESMPVELRMPAATADGATSAYALGPVKYPESCASRVERVVSRGLHRSVDALARTNWSSYNLMDSLLTKHPGFADENEWRVIYVPVFSQEDEMSKSVLLPEDLRPPPTRKSRQSGHRLVTFVEMPIAAATAVASIRLGPRCPLDVNELAFLARARGLNHVQLSQSTIPYRR